MIDAGRQRTQGLYYITRYQNLNEANDLDALFFSPTLGIRERLIDLSLQQQLEDFD